MCSTIVLEQTVNIKRPQVTPNCANICLISNLPRLMKVSFGILVILSDINGLCVFSNEWDCFLVQRKLWNMPQMNDCGNIFISINSFIKTHMLGKIKLNTYSETKRQNMLCAFSRSNKNCLACSGPSSSLALILFNSMSLKA